MLSAMAHKLHAKKVIAEALALPNEPRVVSAALAHTRLERLERLAREDRAADLALHNLATALGVTL